MRRSTIRLDRKAITTGEITRIAPIAPSVRSVIGTGTAAEVRPSREAFDRQVFVRNAPPPGERPFAAREQQLQKNPGWAPEPSTVKSLPDRDDNTAQKVRVIGEQRGAVDARAAGSRRGSGMTGIPSAAPGQLRPLDRSVEPAKESVPGPGDRSRDIGQKGQRDVQQQQQAAEKQQAERKRQVETQQQRQAECERQTIRQHQDASQCRSETPPQEPPRIRTGVCKVSERPALSGVNPGSWRANRDWTQAVFFDRLAVAESGDVFTGITYNRKRQPLWLLGSGGTGFASHSVSRTPGQDTPRSYTLNQIVVNQ